MDNVHGYIRIPAVFVDNIIDTREFQRLRNVDQTGMKILYPSAKHDRFAHSLGVFHLGNIAVDALLENFRDNPHWKIRSNNTRYVYWAKNKVLFLVACLLHDVGHAPFSHSLERFYDFDSRDELQKLCGVDEVDEEENSDIQKAALHEQMSAYLVLKSGSPWRARIKSILDHLNGVPFPEPLEPVIGEYDKEFPKIDSEDLEEDLRFIARMIMGVKYRNFEPEKQARNCFIELLNGSIDVDKLDYVVRDTQMSGIENTTIDIKRLLGALTIIPTTVYTDYTFDDAVPEYTNIIIRELDLTFEEDEEYSVQIQGTLDRAIRITEGNVSVPSGTKISLKRSASNATEFLHFKSATFDSNSVVKIDGKSKSNTPQHTDEISVDGDPNGKTNLELDSATVKKTCVKNFEFSVEREGNYQLWIHSSAENEPIKLKAEASLANARFSGKIMGTVKRLEVLSDELSDNGFPPEKNRYTGYFLGFTKQAINLISNVFDARNYLYLWIYSHHKVVYYANYLIIELARLAVPATKTKTVELLKEKLSKTITDFDNSYMLDEDYMRSLMRAAQEHLSEDNSEYARLFEELISRKYRQSLYKSLAEFDLIFDKYDTSSKMEIKRHLEKDMSENAPSVPKLARNASRLEALDNLWAEPSKLQYGKIKTSCLEKMELSETVDDLLWIAVKPSFKRPDPSQILIAFKSDSIIVTLDRLPILKSETYTGEQNHYFYLYFRPKSSSSNGSDNIKAKIKEAFLSYMDKFVKKNTSSEK